MGTNPITYETAGFVQNRDESRAIKLNQRGHSLSLHQRVKFGATKAPTHHRRRATKVINETTIPNSGKPVISRPKTS